MGTSDSPSSVRKYSVFIGTVLCTTRLATPTASSSPSCCTRTRRVAPFITRWKSTGRCMPPRHAVYQIWLPFAAHHILRNRDAAVEVYRWYLMFVHLVLYFSFVRTGPMAFQARRILLVPDAKLRNIRRMTKESHYDKIITYCRATAVYVTLQP